MPRLSRNSIRILHVEDDNDFAELSALSLRKFGFAQPVTRCKDGLFALRYFSAIDPKCGPHVILLDLNMPRMNGLEVLHWLRLNYKPSGVAIYLLTSSDDPAHKRQAEADGVTEYLIKSFSTNLLVEKLDIFIAKINADEEVEAPDNAKSLPSGEGLASFPEAQTVLRLGPNASPSMG